MFKKKQNKLGIIPYALGGNEPSENEGQKKVPSIESKYYTSYSKLSEVKILTIGMASPLRILQWAEKTLPNGRIYGEVTNANTLHHKTFKPQKGGLFCERIFGPLKDFECACGKVDKSVKQESGLPLNKGTVALNGSTNSLTSNRKFCPECDVEYTWSVIRRYQLGYIKLNSPVLHIWFLKGTPSYLSILLDIKKRHLQNLAYCSETITLENAFSQQFVAKSLSLDSPSKIYSSWKNVLKKVSLEKTSQPFFSNPTFSNKDVFRSTNDFLNLSEKQKIQEYRRLKRFKFAALDSPLRGQSPTTQKQSFQEQNKILPILSNKLNTTNGDFKKRISLTQKQSLLKLISALQFSFSYDSLSLKQNLLFGSQLNENSFLNALKTSEILNNLELLHFSNVSFSQDLTETLKSLKKTNSAMNGISTPKGPKEHVHNLKRTFFTNKNDDFYLTESFMIFNRLVKRLPIDLYIVSSLEHILHKKVLTFSIYKLWQRIYQKAYFKAILSATKLVTNSNANLMNSMLTKEYSSMINISLTSQNQTSLIEEIENFKLYTYQKSAYALNDILQTTKKSFKTWVFEKLSSLDEPFYSLELTSNISQNNAYLLNIMSEKLEKRLEVSFKVSSTPNSTDLKTNVLSTNLFETNGTHAFNSQLVSNMRNMDSYTTINLTNNYSLNAPSATIDLFIKKISTSFMRPLLVILFLEQLKKTLLKNDNIDEYSENSLVFEQSNPLRQSNQSFSNLKENVQTQLLSTLPWVKTNANTDILSQRFKKLNAGTNLKQLSRRIPISLHSNLGQKSRQKAFKRPLAGMNFQNEPRSLVNPIYTLSHRERWTSTKDWDFFQLYNTVASDYTDSPIPNYKSRIFSFTEKSSFDFLNFSKGNGNLDNSGDLDSILSPAFFSGPGLVQQLLNEFNFAEIKKLDKQNRLLLYQLNQSIFKLKKQSELYAYEKNTQKELKELCKKRDLLIRRTKLVRKFFRKDSDPSSMILTVLPVLPPDLRPIVKMGNQIAASDLNRLYQRVIYRNERLKKFLKDPATSQSYEMKYAQRLLQEAVDNLIQNGKSGNNSEKDNKNRPLKSLSDILKGKQGRFRQFLLGKRVDYSGRSVIVVGPKLKLHECGLPFEMAIELYLPFLLKLILNKNYAKTVIGAKSLIKKNTALAHELLREIMQVSPVLLNRAPTLHRLGIQAFVPKLVEGRAILLHPLVCSAFNADFDGDQMAVHVPITVEARAEAWKLMLARNNILSTATGEPLAIPSQDMVLGCYYLTTLPNQMKFVSVTGQPLTPNSNISLLYFKNFDDVITAYNQQKIYIHSLVWVQWNNSIENGADQEEPIEIRLSEYGHWQEITSNYHRFFSFSNQLVNQYMLTTPGRILFNLILQNINP